MTDPAVAESPTAEHRSRRALLGAGLVGAALAIAAPRAAEASTGPGLSDADKRLAAFAIALELTARDLYDEAIAAGSTSDAWSIMREQHEAYATRLAGLAGLSANTRDDAVFDSLQGAFATVDPVDAAQDLENVAAATHIGLLDSIQATSMASIVSAIAAMESRHSTVLGLIAGKTGSDLFTNPAAALEA
ncbi:MAG: hypothetical protein RLZZ01_894 [Actinomycetota bacterium]